MSPTIIVLAMFSAACVKRVSVNPVLPTVPEVATETLINRINSYGDIKTFSAEAENIWFLNYFTGEGTKADRYPATAGSIRFQRPENTRMRVSFAGKKLSDMVSDGRTFKLAVYWPDEKRRFIHGTNLKDLERMDLEEIRDVKDPRLSEAGGLVNLRPQHITDSFLIKPISDSDRPNVFREEVRQVERASRDRKDLVERTYYVLYVLDRDGNGQVKLRRKFWFDRTLADTPLVRQQTYDNGDGRLASDVTYSEWFAAPGAATKLPKRVVIDRRADGYRLDLELDTSSVVVNEELPETTFVLENEQRLEELDLDKPRKANVTRVPANVVSNRNSRNPRF